MYRREIIKEKADIRFIESFFVTFVPIETL